MPDAKRPLTLTATAELAEDLRRLARAHDVPIEALLHRMCNLLFVIEEHNRQGYVMGFSKDPSVLDVRIVGLLDKG